MKIPDSGNGVVVNLDSFFAELEHNRILELPGWEKRIMISEHAHLVFAVHMQVDGRQEDARERYSPLCYLFYYLFTLVNILKWKRVRISS